MPNNKIEVPIYSGYCKSCAYHPSNCANSLQQLKAEIAALVAKFEVPDGLRLRPSLDYLINELRQLSAV
jgi:hypothetical protein